MEVLVVGLGSMGKRRARLIRGVEPSAALAGVDFAPARREEARALGIEPYESIAAAVAARHFDAAFVCTAPLTHAGIIGELLDAGLQVLAAMVRNHMSLHDLCSGMKMFPQLLVNVRYTAGSGDPLEHENVKAVMAEVEAALGNRGRVLLRKSGTEPLIRVMVEGEDEAQVTEFAHRIADAVKAV